METTEPNRLWQTGKWLYDDQAASSIQKEMHNCFWKYTTKLCMLPTKYLLLGYFCLRGVDCTEVPGAHFSSLKADLGSIREQARFFCFRGAMCVCAPAPLGQVAEEEGTV